MHPVFLTCALGSRQGTRLSDGWIGEDSAAQRNWVSIGLLFHSSWHGRWAAIRKFRLILASISAKSRHALLTTVCTLLSPRSTSSSAGRHYCHRYSSLASETSYRAFNESLVSETTYYPSHIKRPRARIQNHQGGGARCRTKKSLNVYQTLLPA